jgi:hypothetical protein
MDIHPGNIDIVIATASGETVIFLLSLEVIM